MNGTNRVTLDNHPVVEATQTPHAELLERVLAEPRHTLAEVKEMAKTVTRSGLYGMTEAQCETLMLICQAEGCHPIEALRRYHIIEGRPAMRADYMHAVFQAHGGRLNWLESTPETCTAEFWHPMFHPEPTRFTVTMKELNDSGVTRGKEGTKANYRRHPRQMLRARVLTEGIRAIDPGVIVGMYSDEEVESLEPPPAQQAAHDELRKKLQARREAGQRERAPAAIEPAPEAAIEPEQKSEFRTWVDEQLEEFNREPGVKTISPYQVANHLIKVGIAEGIVDEKAITRPDGKRDKDAAALLLNVLWEEEGGWVMDTAGKYLAEKSVEGLKATAEPVGNGSSAAPVQQALPV